MTFADSPALVSRSEHWPWPREKGVPRRVRITQRGGVRSELPFPPILHAPCGQIREVWVNSHGAVSAILDDGQALGLLPGEFEIVEWWQL